MGSPFRSAEGKLTYAGMRTVTQLSFTFNVIPKECPVCGRPIIWRSTRFYFWGHISKSKCVHNNTYRRLCWSCYRTLKRAFGEGVAPWEEQYALLKDEQCLPEDAQEGWWSVVTVREERQVLKRLGEGEDDT